MVTVGFYRSWYRLVHAALVRQSDGCGPELVRDLMRGLGLVPCQPRWVEHGPVFPTRVGTPIESRDLNRHFEGIRTRAGYPLVRLHDFRHTVVSLLFQLRTPPHVVQRIARHPDLEVTLTHASSAGQHRVG